jgi:hypothetical protein
MLPFAWLAANRAFFTQGDQKRVSFWQAEQSTEHFQGGISDTKLLKHHQENPRHSSTDYRWR